MSFVRELRTDLKTGYFLSGFWLISVHRRNSRFWTNFLNHETAFFEGVEKISRKLELAIVFMDIRKVSRGHYEVRLEKLFDNAAITAENEVTLSCVGKMEEEISTATRILVMVTQAF